MRVKKFVCDRCGAPKVNSYKGIYVACDYCSHMIDIDFAAGMQVWNRSEEETNKFLAEKQKYHDRSAKYLQEKNLEAHRKEQYNYWDFYYTTYPEYLPPNVSKGEKYKLYVQAIADIIIDEVFGVHSQKSIDYYNAYSNLMLNQMNKVSFLDYDLFLKLVDAYIDFISQGFHVIYNDPKYRIMHEVLPEELQLKLKLSELTQIWIPHLADKDVDNFLEKYQLKHEYVEIDDPQLTSIICEDCTKQLSVPTGAITCICEHCRHENILCKTIHCTNCGMENDLPENWKLLFNCKSCSTELRVVHPLFV